MTAEFAAVGATALLEAVRRAAPDARVYQAASSEIFGEPLHAPQTEDTPIMPVTPYGAAKAYSFFIVRSYDAATACTRRPGSSTTTSRRAGHSTFCPARSRTEPPGSRSGSRRRSQLGDLEARRDWGYAGDYVRAMALMLRQDEPDDYVIATGVTHSVQDLVEYAFAHVDLDWREHVRVDAVVATRKGRAPQSRRRRHEGPRATRLGAHRRSRSPRSHARGRGRRGFEPARPIGQPVSRRQLSTGTSAERPSQHLGRARAG